MMLSKNDLKNAIASKNRGISATIADKQVIASIIARVEDLNPTPDPLSAPELLTGDWRLLYTTSQELLGIDRVPLATLGNIYQCVRPKDSRIYNIAEINGLPYLDGLVSVVANFTPADSESLNSGSLESSGPDGAKTMATSGGETSSGGTAVAIAPKKSRQRQLQPGNHRPTKYAGLPKSGAIHPKNRAKNSSQRKV